MTTNANLHRAKDIKNDEFYTKFADVLKELTHYKHHFRGKVVYCNCDNPPKSAFWKYFHLNFAELGLKKLISTHYSKEDMAYKMEYGGGDDNNIEAGIKTLLEGDGDFRSKECIDLLEECDVVVTNPPFSLFRAYVACLVKYEKKFIIIGSQNAITYGEFFPLLRDNEVWIGYNSVKEFVQPDGSTKKFGNICWYTNLDVEKRHEKLILWKTYSSDKYPTYANYDAINVDRVSEIPCDYDGVMGVPITFLGRHSPEQFEIVGLGIASLGLECGVKPYRPHHKKYRKEVQHKGQVDGDLYMVDENDHPVVPYARILIRSKVGT